MAAETSIQLYECDWEIVCIRFKSSTTLNRGSALRGVHWVHCNDYGTGDDEKSLRNNGKPDNSNEHGID